MLKGRVKVKTIDKMFLLPKINIHVFFLVQSDHRQFKIEPELVLLYRAVVPVAAQQ